MARSVALSLLFVAASTATPLPAVEPASAVASCNCEHCRSSSCAKQGNWFVVETDNFSVWTTVSRHLASEAAESCEQLRGALQSSWKLSDVSWQPKCAVVLHPRIDDYRRELGSGNSSVGCTTVTCDDDRIVFRRIDLRVDVVDWRSNALPHELSHVVLADRFAGLKLPQWLNEGLAMLAENSELQNRRDVVLKDAHGRGEVPSLTEILTADETPLHPDDDVSYALSASLVRHLEARLGRDSLLDFAGRLADPQSDPLISAETLSQIGGIQTLERRWHDAIARIEPAPLRRP